MNQASNLPRLDPVGEPKGQGLRQFLWITAAAVAVFAGFRLLPTGTNLSHMDFRATGANVIEFCDPLNPQFISVVAARSPVEMTVTEVSGSTGAVHGVVALKTGSGKPVAPEDLLITHTKPLHLLIIDPTLEDYQHVHPQPGHDKGEWTFSFTPRRAGIYRVFADFTPAVTARGLYASADLTVAAPVAEMSRVARSGDTVDLSGYRFKLTTGGAAVHAGQPIDLTFAINRPGGGAVPLKPVMGAYAHLVAFDESRSGFAHLHPVEADLLEPPGPQNPVLRFKLTIPQPGSYVVWAQVNVAGEEMFVPFALTVI